MAVADASVILAAIHPADPHHEISLRWLEALLDSGGHFSAPAILLSEVAAPLGRAYNQPELAKKVVQTLLEAPFIQLVPVSAALAQQAAGIAATGRIRGCDAVYVALAELLGEELVTLDRQQGERAGTVPVVALWKQRRD
jgi:predicted nucleic acid-binding protein